MAEDTKVKGALGGLMSAEDAKDAEGEEETGAENEDAAIDAIGAFMAALKSGDKGEALEAYRSLMLAEC